MGTDRKVAGSVVQLRCNACERVFPYFRFEGEDDTDTIGLGSLTTCLKNELVIASFLPDEWNSLPQGGSARFEARVREELGRDDLYVVRLLRTVPGGTSAAGVSFQDFRKHYRPPELVFSCPCCDQGESRVIEELTVQQFVRSGGRIILAGAFILS